jgi:hypothetical protein
MNKRERETERERIRAERERSGIGGNRRMAWVDFQHW